MVTREMTYVTLAQTEHGELGHNGWTYVLNSPFGADERPAFHEESGYLSVRRDTTVEDDNCDPQVVFPAILVPSRGGIAKRPEFVIPVTVEMARAAVANRASYDATRRPPGGYRFITD